MSGLRKATFPSSAPSQANIHDLWRELQKCYAAMREADAAASVAHDYIYGDEHGTVTMDEANEAIWRIHNALRPLLND
jgi:hypothetical protein